MGNFQQARSMPQTCPAFLLGGEKLGFAHPDVQERLRFCVWGWRTEGHFSAGGLESSTGEEGAGSTRAACRVGSTSPYIGLLAANILPGEIPPPVSGDTLVPSFLIAL